MRIEYDTENVRHYTFRDIDCGQVFLYNDAIYMRIEPVAVGTNVYRVVDLEDGSVWTIEDGKEVTLLDGEYTVKSLKKIKTNS